MKKLVLFAPIAEREVDFYLEYADHMKASGSEYDFHFLSFYQPGNATIEKAGYTVWDLYAYENRFEEFKIPFEKLESFFGIENIQAQTLHEKVTFGISDTKVILEKYHRYLNAIDIILRKILTEYPAENITIFQELGGFVAPLSLYYNALQKKIQHIFFEPSFFRSHMHFVENSLNCHIPPFQESAADPAAQKLRPEVIKYFDDIRKSQKLVIVKKDIHHYQDMGVRKLVNSRKIEKLWKKISNKFIHNHRQEYEWIANHVFRAIRQFFNRIRLGKYYVHEIPSDKFFYFPFHVQLDYQLTIRNPEFLNQLALVKHLCEICPAGYKIVVKEHPVSIGGFNFSEMRELLKNNSNLVLLQPLINTHDILPKAEAIITINSKVGAESLIYGKRVACLGNGFYWNSGVVRKIDGFTGIRQWFNDIRSGQEALPNEDQIISYFSGVLAHSADFELYNHTPENLARFKAAMTAYLTS
jgi:hypothetical protein